MAGLSLQEIIAKEKNKSAKNRTALGPQEDTGGFIVTMIPVDKLHDNEKNSFGIREVEILADSIEMLNGIKQNLLVRERADGEYDVVAGHKRKAAAELLVSQGKTQYRLVPCKVENYIKRAEDIENGTEGGTMDPDVLEELDLIFTNTTQREQTIYERTKAVARLRELIPQLPGMEGVKERVLRKLIAETMKLSEGSVAAIDNINRNLCTEGVMSFGKGEINFETAKELAGLTEEEQLMFLNDSELNAKKVKEYKREKEELKNKLTEEEMILIYKNVNIYNIINQIVYERTTFSQNIKSCLVHVKDEQNDTNLLTASVNGIESVDKATGEMKNISYEVLAGQMIFDFENGKMDKYIDTAKIQGDYERKLFMDALKHNAQVFGGVHAENYNKKMKLIRECVEDKNMAGVKREELIVDYLHEIVFFKPGVEDQAKYLAHEAPDIMDIRPNHKRVVFMNAYRNTYASGVYIYNSEAADQPVKMIEYENLVRLVSMMVRITEYKSIDIVTGTDTNTSVIEEENSMEDWTEHRKSNTEERKEEHLEANRQKMSSEEVISTLINLKNMVEAWEWVNTAEALSIAINRMKEQED